MRTRLFSSAIAAAALLAGSAQAANLISATWQQHLEGIDITVTNSGATCTDGTLIHVQQSIVCPVSGLGATGSSTATSYSVSLTMPLFSLSQFTTGGAINVHTRATFSGAQSINGNDSAAAANTGIAGQVTVKVAVHAGKGVNASMLSPGATTLIKLPLAIGEARVDTGYFYLLTSPHYITLDFYAWTPHTLTFTGLTSRYVPLPTPTVVAMGSFNLTANSRGIVTLVSPSKISIDGPIARRRTATFTSLTLVFPEPSALLLLGSGAVGLALVRSRERR